VDFHLLLFAGFNPSFLRRFRARHCKDSQLRWRASKT
jgi:hypothetical protein